MAGKKGMTVKKNREDSPKFAEYYKKEHPEWTIEQCEEKAKWFKRSCNYQCIEYYEKNYPELSHEEHLRIRKELQIQRNQNNPLHFEYYVKNYPKLSTSEQEKLWHEYVRKNNYQCKEYYLKNNISEEEAEKLKNEKVKIAANKISKKVSGEFNGMHSSKTSQEKRNSISPRNIAFYERKYPELSHEEHLKLQKEFFEKNRLAVKKAVKPTNIEYYLNQGYSYEDAYLKLKERQTTNSLEKFIEKYGEEIGNIKYAERQKKWLNSLYKNFQLNGDGRSKQSKFAKELITSICKYFSIEIPKKEFYIYDKQNKKVYAYDFHYNYHIIEFNGDYWHCNPKLYNENFYNKVKQLYAKDIWEYDKAKIDLCNKYNIKTLTIWESQYNHDKEAALQKCIDFIKT